jgi:hypothetical protein
LTLKYTLKFTLKEKTSSLLYMNTEDFNTNVKRDSPKMKEHKERMRIQKIRTVAHNKIFDDIQKAFNAQRSKDKKDEKIKIKEEKKQYEERKALKRKEEEEEKEEEENKIIKELRESNKIYDRKYWVIEYDDDGTPYAEHNTRTEEHRYLYKNRNGEYRFDYNC